MATSQTAIASDCDEVVKKNTANCIDALKKADEVIASQDKLIKLQYQKLQIQSDALDNARQGYEYYKNKTEAWYRQPEFLIPVGLVAGFLIAERLR